MSRGVPSETRQLLIVASSAAPQPHAWQRRLGKERRPSRGFPCKSNTPPPQPAARTASCAPSPARLHVGVVAEQLPGACRAARHGAHLEAALHERKAGSGGGCVSRGGRTVALAWQHVHMFLPQPLSPMLSLGVYNLDVAMAGAACMRLRMRAVWHQHMIFWPQSASATADLEQLGCHQLAHAARRPSNQHCAAGLLCVESTVGGGVFAGGCAGSALAARKRRIGLRPSRAGHLCAQRLRTHHYSGFDGHHMGSGGPPQSQAGSRTRAGQPRRLHRFGRVC